MPCRLGIVMGKVVVVGGSSDCGNRNGGDKGGGANNGVGTIENCINGSLHTYYFQENEVYKGKWARVAASWKRQAQNWGCCDGKKMVCSEKSWVKTAASKMGGQKNMHLLWHQRCQTVYPKNSSSWVVITCSVTWYHSTSFLKLAQPSLMKDRNPFMSYKIQNNISAESRSSCPMGSRPSPKTTTGKMTATGWRKSGGREKSNMPLIIYRPNLGFRPRQNISDHTFLLFFICRLPHSPA